MWLLWAFRCYIAELGAAQQNLASIVAAREVLYLLSTAFALFKLPSFLLLDLKTVWNEASPLERLFRFAMYILCPHNFVAFCSAKCFPEWRCSFKGLAGAQIVADFSSCFALAALLASSVSDLDGKVESAAPLKVGYSITALGFILFFGPLSVATSFEGALDTQRHRLVRLLRGVGGSALLLSLIYIAVCFVLLLCGKDIFCDGFTFQTDPCNGHGECYAAAQCRCTPGYGPESKASGKPLCIQENYPCTARQLLVETDKTNSICCSRRGTATSTGCECDTGFNGPFGPEDFSSFWSNAFNNVELRSEDFSASMFDQFRLCGTKQERCTETQVARAEAIEASGRCSGMCCDRLVLCGDGGSCECKAGLSQPICQMHPCRDSGYQNVSQAWRDARNGDHGPEGSWMMDLEFDGSNGSNYAPPGYRSPGYPSLSAVAQATGVGGGRWYRFIGVGGDALPLIPPGGYHCGTWASGWLSGWEVSKGTTCSPHWVKTGVHCPGTAYCYSGRCGPPTNYSTPGHYPTAAEGVAEMTACFDDGRYTMNVEDQCIVYTVIGVAQCNGFLLWRLPSAVSARGAVMMPAGYCTASAPAIRHCNADCSSEHGSCDAYGAPEPLFAF